MLLKRPIRSMLFVPGNRESWIEKAKRSQPDALVLDLEDSVPQIEKVNARKIVTSAIAAHLCQEILLYVRINKGSFIHDLEDLAAVVKNGLHGLFVPKVETPEEVIALSNIVSEMESNQNMAHGSVGLVIALETAKAVQYSHDIAKLPRVQTLVACTARNADVARNLGFTWTKEGLETLYHRSQGIISCKAAGKDFPIGGLWQDVHDLIGLREFATFNRNLGFSGEIVLHPSNVSIINEVYSLSETEKNYYKGMIKIFAEAEANGKASIMYDGEHIDIAHVTTARAMLSMDEDK